jgi:putative SOS response-associated peptidase YedK
LPDKPARNDVLYPGTYNARRDDLEGYWRGAFGLRHGVVVVQAFYEHVPATPSPAAASVPTKEQDVVLEFRPDPPRDLLLACLWAEWEGPEGRLLSFCHDHRHTARDVAAAGHDRGVVPIHQGTPGRLAQPRTG